MLSRTTEYALRAVLYLAKSGGRPHTTQAIAEAVQVPEGYLAKVLSTLARAGVLNAQRGPSGGFSLARPPERVTMLDVVDALDALPEIKECPLRLPEHAPVLCPLHRRLDEMVTTMRRTLAATTVAELLEESDAPRACDFPPVAKPTVRGRV
ncbi:MAG: Rrf2 family transcriptional regulator [Phycisphaeraceae bacterium]|nr:Rrf2 family transcriptional regulator [Phycisphaeraceae bacterium]